MLWHCGYTSWEGDWLTDVNSIPFIESSIYLDPVNDRPRFAVRDLWVAFHPKRLSYSDIRYYLPTPPLGQDMTQGQFLSGV